MFPTSTQRKHWMYSDENDINQLRKNANAKHVALYGANYSVSYYFTAKVPLQLLFLRLCTLFLIYFLYIF